MGAKADVNEFSGAFVGSHDLSFARALGGLLLTYCLPCDGTATAADEESRERPILKKFKWGTVGDCVDELATPVSDAECGKLVDFRQRRRSCVGVSLFVMMVWEVIESLESVGCVGMEGYAVFAGTVEIL